MYTQIIALLKIINIYFYYSRDLNEEEDNIVAPINRFAGLGRKSGSTRDLEVERTDSRFSQEQV